MRAAAALALMMLAVAAPADDEEWYRTRIPEITSERWESAPEPVPDAGAVTRHDYLEFIERNLAGRLQYDRGHAGDPELKHQHLAARREGFFYRVTGDEEHARTAMRMIRGDLAYWTEGPGGERGTGFNVIVPALQAWQWIRTSPSMTEQDQDTVRQWLRTIEAKAERFEYGPMNRAAGWAVGREMLAVLLPDDERNEERREYAATVWDEWWPFRDTSENSEGYNALWLHYMVRWIEWRGERERYADPGMRALAMRFLQQATPPGPMPQYGDGPGFNNHPGRWIALLEHFARVYRDGRFRWVAHRMFEWTLEREDAMWQWGNINHNTADALMEAWMAADDTVKPVRPAIGSLVTHRHDMRFVPKEVRRETNRHEVLLDDEIPDKLIMRTGWDPGDSFALVELCRPLGHGQGDAGGICSYISRGSVLLSDTPYIVRDHRFHNCFTCEPWPAPEERWRWRHDDFASMRTWVPTFAESPMGSYAEVQINEYMQQPVTLTRRIMMLGDAGLWVRDTVEADEACSVRVGPAWQTVAIYGERGERWVNTCHVTIPVAYIWELQYMMQWPNRAWDLLVWFAPDEAAEMAVEDVTHDDTRWIVSDPLMNNFTRRIACRSVEQLQPEQSRSFETVLVPHASTPDAGELAAGIEAHVSRGARGVRVPGEDGAVTWAIGNPRGRTVQMGPLETDARVAMVTLRHDRLTGYWAVDATTLKATGRTLLHEPERTSACDTPE